MSSGTEIFMRQDSRNRLLTVHRLSFFRANYFLTYRIRRVFLHLRMATDAELLRTTCDGR
jgi:hypothetical protein